MSPGPSELLATTWCQFVPYVVSILYRLHGRHDSHGWGSSVVRTERPRPSVMDEDDKLGQARSGSGLWGESEAYEQVNVEQLRVIFVKLMVHVCLKQIKGEALKIRECVGRRQHLKINTKWRWFFTLSRVLCPRAQDIWDGVPFG